MYLLFSKTWQTRKIRYTVCDIICSISFQFSVRTLVKIRRDKERRRTSIIFFSPYLDSEKEILFTRQADNVSDMEYRLRIDFDRCFFNRFENWLPLEIRLPSKISSRCLVDAWSVPFRDENDRSSIDIDGNLYFWLIASQFLSHFYERLDTNLSPSIDLSSHKSRKWLENLQSRPIIFKMVRVIDKRNYSLVA